MPPVHRRLHINLDTTGILEKEHFDIPAPYHLSGGRQGFPSALLAQRRLEALDRLLRALKEAFRDRLFLSLYHGRLPGDDRRVRILRSLAQDRGLPYVAALEVRQATPELFPLLDALTCARLGISVGTFPQEASHLERPRNEALALPSREEALDRIPFPEAWAAARDLGRALGLPAELRRRLTKTLGRDFRHLSPHRAREAEPLFREVLGEAPVKELLLRLLSLMEKGHVRHLMPHVGGVVVAPGPLTRYAPVVRSAGGVRMLTLDKDDLEALGLVKLEFPLLFPSIPPGFGAGRESPSGKGSSPTPAPGRHSFRPVSRVSALTRGETSPHTSAEAGEGSPFSG
ncbi:hypothetical protein CSW29_06740 [Thermus scotoductus]|uniref:Bacterial DNA polymerase III alpha subunit NTPase domain-containing protein n=1 Tax=Thermus scotoductus TaxID=37636 RepID=A0A430UGU9_THESC|nr:hypothetical protein [Thermus scotoductus]RTH99974.1 hypothetical protein CSW29_06740 [Thermus scotoductus]